MQFKFLQMEYPPVALAFERLLLSATLPLGAAVQTWGVVSAVGASAAAYYLAALLALMYYALVLPLPSSFYKAQAGHGIGEPSSPPLTPAPRSDQQFLMTALGYMYLWCMRICSDTEHVPDRPRRRRQDPK